MDMRFLNKKQLTQQQLTDLNETESFFELIAEEVFDMDIPETDEPDIDKNKQLKVFFCSDSSMAITSAPSSFQPSYSLYNSFIKDIFVDTDDHPPNCFG